MPQAYHTGWIASMLAPIPKAAPVLLDALGHAVHTLVAWGTVVMGLSLMKGPLQQF